MADENDVLELAKVTPKRRREMRKLAVDLPLLMHRCHAVGLYATGHLVHEAVRKVGWEIEYLEKKVAK